MSHLLSLALCLLLGACAPVQTPATEYPRVDVDDIKSELPATGLSLVRLEGPDGVFASFQVEIADDLAELQRGLMFRETLPAGQGMLFVFTQEQPLSFWMKNTKIPLDIAFFADDGTFVSETSMVPCEKDPCPTYPSEGPAKYALEVNVGALAGARLNADWKLVLDVDSES